MLVTFGFQRVKDGFGLRGDFSIHYQKMKRLQHS